MLLDPSPLSHCHTFSDPFPLERDVLYERPLYEFEHASSNLISMHSFQ